jgi:di/tricarboxylate transporter
LHGPDLHQLVRLSLSGAARASSVLIPMGFATPMAYQTNLLIYTAGGCRFADFVRSGVPLVLLLWAAFSVLLAVFYDL